MVDGTIENCRAELGSGVFVAYGTFTMNGGAIPTQWFVNTNKAPALKQAIDAGIPSIKLVNDITLSNILDLSDHDITLDLNSRKRKHSAR